MALPPNPFGLSTERQDSHAVPRPQWGCSPRRCIDIVFTLCSHAFMGHLEDDLPFRVEQWDVASAATRANPVCFGRPPPRQGSVLRGSSAAAWPAHLAKTWDTGDRGASEVSEVLLAERGAQFSATIQRTEDGPQASYLVIGDEGDWTRTQSDMRLFETETAAMDWLKAEAERRGFTRYPFELR